MTRTVAGLVFILACLSCAGPQVSAPTNGAFFDSPVAEFAGPGGTIRIDLEHLSLAVADARYPIADCSTTEFYCFKNEALGFHVVFARLCTTRAHAAGETLGGFNFYQFAGMEHGDARQGRYASELSDRFSYVYFLNRGLTELQYDRSGATRFGPRQARAAGYGAWRPFTYRLAEGRTFLRCRG